MSNCGVFYDYCLNVKYLLQHIRLAEITKDLQTSIPHRPSDGTNRTIIC